MRLIFLTLLPSLLLAQTEPRVFDITPIHSIPEAKPSLVFLNANHPDLFFPASAGGNAYQKTNFLCQSLDDGVTFSTPIITGYRNESETIRDGPPVHFRILDQHLGNYVSRTFLNEIHLSPAGNTYVPRVHDTFPLGAYNPRESIAPPQSHPWIPADLGVGSDPVFLQAVPVESVGTELFIWEKQADGTHSAQSIVYASTFTFDRISLLHPLSFNDELPVLHLFSEGVSGSHILLTRDSPLGFSDQPRFLTNIPSDITFADLNADSLHDIIYVQDNRIYWHINQGDFAMSTVQSHPLPSLGFGTDAATHIPSPPNAQNIFVAQTTGDQLRFMEIEFGTWDILREQQIDISAIQTYSKLELLGFYPKDADGTPAILLRVEKHFPHNSTYFVNRLAIARFEIDGPHDPGGTHRPAEFVHPSPLDTTITLVADFDGNGTQDIILGPDLEGHVALLTNDGTGKFSPPTLLTELAPPEGSPQADPGLENPFQPGASQGTQIAQILAADINGDLIPDLVIRYQNLVYWEGRQTAYAIALGVGNGRFHEPTLAPDAFDTIPQRPIEIDHLVDWDGDGKIDLIAQGRWHKNLGSHFSPTGTPLASGVNSTDIFGNHVEIIKTSVGDLNGDGHPDIISLVTSIEDSDPFNPLVRPLSYSTAYFNDGSGSISHTAEFRSDLASTDVFGNPIIGDLAIADMNLDGLPDIHHTDFSDMDIYGNHTPSTVWKRNPGNGSLDPESWQTFPIANNPVAPSSPFLDFDGDRQPEWVNRTGYLKPTPQGPIVSPHFDFIGNLDLNPYSPIRVADFDGDGDADFLHLYGIQLTLIKNTLVDETNIITRKFLANGILPSLASPHADADGDGRDNLTELIQGTNPFVADPEPSDPFHQKIAHRYREHDGLGSEQSYVSFEVPINADEYGITHEFEKSHDLRHWQNIPPNQYSVIDWNPPYPRKTIIHGYDPDLPSTYFRVKSYQK